MKDYTKDKNFWERLELFVKDVQVNCCAGEEEKEMILNCCKSKLKQFELADKIIKEMEDVGLTLDDMLIVIKLARENFNEFKK